MGNQPSNENRQSNNNNNRNFSRSNNNRQSSSAAAASLSLSLNNSSNNNNSRSSPRVIKPNHSHTNQNQLNQQQQHNHHHPLHQHHHQQQQQQEQEQQQEQQQSRHHLPSHRSSHQQSSSSVVRPRKSLELPDLEPLTSASSSETNNNNNPKRNRSSNHRSIRSSINLISNSSSSSSQSSSSSSAPPTATITFTHHENDEPDQHMRDGDDDDESKDPGPRSIPGIPSGTTVSPGRRPQDDQVSKDGGGGGREGEEVKNDEEDRPGRTLAATPSLIQPDPDLLNLSKLPPAFHLLAKSSPILSLPPLQQPVETVVPPPPPSIVQPFPPPLPQLDSIDVQPPTSVPSGSASALAPNVTETIAAATAAVQAAPALDIGAGSEGVPTLLTWKEPANEVYVTGTFSEWRQQIKLRKPVVQKDSREATAQDGFSALVALPPGPHQLKFIVDKRWKTSKYLPSATDDKGNLINYLQVNPGDQPFRGLGPRGIWSGYTYGNLSNQLGSSLLIEDDESNDTEDDWTTEIPKALMDYEEFHDRLENQYDEGEDDDQDGGRKNSTQANQNDQSTSQPPNPGEVGFAAEPPKLPAQLKEGILNITSKLPEGVVDDNSLLPRPDHSVLNHLAASPIKQGLLSVGVTSRYKRKYLTTVYYKPVKLKNPSINK